MGPFQYSFEFGEEKNVTGGKSGDYDVCSSMAMLFFAEIFRMLEELCARALW